MAKEIRCPRCKKKICEVSGATLIKVICPRCKTQFEEQTIEVNTLQGRNGTKQ